MSLVCRARGRTRGSRPHDMFGGYLPMFSPDAASGRQVAQDERRGAARLVVRSRRALRLPPTQASRTSVEAAPASRVEGAPSEGEQGRTGFSGTWHNAEGPPKQAAPLAESWGGKGSKWRRWRWERRPVPCFSRWSGTWRSGAGKEARLARPRRWPGPLGARR